MLFYTTFARRTFTVSLNELFKNYTGRHTHVYSGRMTRLKYPPCYVWLLYRLLTIVVVQNLRLTTFGKCLIMEKIQYMQCFSRNMGVIYTNEPVAMAIERYKNHPSIIKLNENVSTIVRFILSRLMFCHAKGNPKYGFVKGISNR